MPNFKVDFSGTFENLVWTDPASTDKSSRLTGVNEQQHRRIRMLPGSLQLRATLDGQSAPVSDAVGGVFETWALEHASAAEPQQTHTVGFSAIVDVQLDDIGHYTLGMFHKSDGSPAVITHVDVYEPFEVLASSVAGVSSVAGGLTVT